MRIKGSKPWHSRTQGEYSLLGRGGSRQAAKRAQPCYQTSKNPPDRLVIGTSHMTAGFGQPRRAQGSFASLPHLPPERLSDLLPSSRPSSSSPRRDPLTQRPSRAALGLPQFTRLSHVLLPPNLPCLTTTPCTAPNHPSVPTAALRPTRQRHKT